MSTEAPAIRAEPVPLAARIEAIDVIRGVALLGILVVNMSFFGFAVSHAITEPDMADAPFSERVAWFINHTFFESKFISTFSFLFGAGLTLQMARLDAARRAALVRGERAGSTGAAIVRRMLFLFGIGLMHALLLWYGDILVYYASFGWLLILARYLSARAMVWIGVGFGFLSITCLGGFMLLQSMTPAEIGAPEHVADTGAKIAKAVEGINDPVERVFAALREVQFRVVDPSFADFETATYRDGPFAAALVLRALTWFTFVFVMIFFFMPHVLAMFAFGMAAAKANLFGPSAIARQRAVSIVCVPLGVALCALPTTLTWLADFKLSAAIGVAHAIADWGAMVLAFGYMATIAWIVNSVALHLLARLIANVGRMAFTVYLAETVVMTFVMYWWGLAKIGSLTRVEHLVIAFVTWLGLMILANAWLLVFRMGPMEWVWRMATYCEVPQLLNRGPAE